MRRVMTAIKVRGSGHGSELHLYDIGDDGIVVGEVLSGYQGLLTGSPVAIAGAAPSRTSRGTRRTTRQQQI
jgi:circadian clock protein KaiC